MEANLLYLSGVLALGVTAQWLAWRFRVPSILLLLLFGFAAGQSPRFTDPEQLVGEDLFYAIVSLSVAVILFEGGLSLRISELRAKGGMVARLVTMGAVITWLLTTLAARFILGLTLEISLLVGAILTVTGPTVIMPLLRHVRPTKQLGAVAKWEGIVIDPIGAVLAALVFEAVSSEGIQAAASHTLLGLLATAAFGGTVGIVAAVLLVQLLKRFLVPDYLENVVILTVVLASFTLSNVQFHESGLVAVTILGVALANQKAVTVHHVVMFKENLQVLLLSVLFILLGSKLKLNDLLELGWPGLLFLLSLLFVVRPAAVFLSTWGGGMNNKERMFLAWLAPRGIVAAAVSSLFALQLSQMEGLDPAVAADATELAPIVFLTIVGTVAIYGLTLSPLARWLGMAEPTPQGILFAGASLVVRTIAKSLQDEGFQVLLVDTNHQNIMTARMQGLPTVQASILSEYVNEELDLSGIGRLATMTPNDEVNALAVMEFDHVFGRAGIFQVAPNTAGKGRQDPAKGKFRARVLFDRGATYSNLTQRMVLGAVVKKTKLTEEFDFEDFRALYGPDALVLFVLDDGELKPRTSESTTVPTAGQTIISLVQPMDETERQIAATEAEEAVTQEQEERLQKAVKEVTSDAPTELKQSD